ncbi:hypothetical protein GXM_02849 [Nostoc sphaeroides CCNUC1]|uniref:Uncharacterized protein n=1 Tax=Nostoc sphaeroides CCNUC1 TaxID=2653204 RepID=A0A5P8VY69_9NOSO|nr:hypothetical protein GXM_02849 [Nostoc sphaeroides CCNUC1]
MKSQLNLSSYKLVEKITQKAKKSRAKVKILTPNSQLSIFRFGFWIEEKI